MRKWCKQYQFPAQRVFHFLKYGVSESAELSREFCRRGEFFYTRYLASGDPLYKFSQADVDAYQESEAWLDFVCSLSIEANAFEKAMEIRRLSPRLDG